MGMLLSLPLMLAGIALDGGGDPARWRTADIMTDEITPLEAEIRRRIEIAGPMPVAQYMALCLTHPEHGYYTTRDPLGAAGDFITAPEISQMFGELIGLWAAAAWRAMGSPDNVRLVELGPGRGTMMLDALRAAKVMPEFRAAIVRAYGRDQPGAGAPAAPGLDAARRAGLVASRARGGAGRPADHPRQRVLRCAAGPSGRDVRRRLARARGQDRRGRQFAFQHRSRSDPAVRRIAAARPARGEDRRDFRMARRHDRARARPARGALRAAPR